jgi:hypothetical protein
MRLPRMTTRRWMIAVAVDAVPLGVVLERRSRFLTLSHYHKVQAGSLVFDVRGGRDAMRPIVTRKDGTRISYALHNWHDSLRWKYQQAARYPWLPSWPDPPPTE